MRYGLNDDAVKRIASVAFERGIGKDVHGHVSSVFHSLSTPEGIALVTNAHTSGSMQHKFKDKDEETSFKNYLAKSAAINRGTLEPVEAVIPKSKGKRTN
jgi:hypothetical protein